MDDTLPDWQRLPDEMFLMIFQCLSAHDLFHVASCNRRLHHVANQDTLWRPLCQKHGWERFDTATFIELSPNAEVSFGIDTIVTNDRTIGQLGATCKWQIIYMKVTQLERNWLKDCYRVASYDLRDVDQQLNSEYISCMDIERDYLVVGLSNEKVQIWDVNTKTCKHIITVNACAFHSTGPMVKNDIIVVGCKDNAIRAYSAITGELLNTLKPTTQENTGAYFDRILFDGEIVVSTLTTTATFLIDHPEHSDISVWNVRHEDCTYNLSEESDIIDLDYQDKIIAVVYSDGCLRLWDASNGIRLHTFRDNSINGEDLKCCLGDGIVVLVNYNYDSGKITVWSTSDYTDCKSSSVSQDLIGLSVDTLKSYGSRIYLQGEKFIATYNVEKIFLTPWRIFEGTVYGVGTNINKFVAKQNQTRVFVVLYKGESVNHPDPMLSMQLASLYAYVTKHFQPYWHIIEWTHVGLQFEGYSPMTEPNKSIYAMDDTKMLLSRDDDKLIIDIHHYL